MTTPRQGQETGGEEGTVAPAGPRRTFFIWMIRLIPSVMGLSLVIPLIGYVSGPAFRRRVDSWTAIGKVADLPSSEPQELEYTSTIKDGWRTTSAKKGVWVVKQTNGEITAFSPLCPHLGCGYRWDASAKQFQCPCHGSVYDVTGKVLAGPAPRPLDRLPTKVEGGQLLVMYKDFKSGLAHAVEL
ncbi:MAG: ubiquinol-cytochrome c reductase iron-sulfur subunit [Nitrospiraceae bacterium]